MSEKPPDSSKPPSPLTSSFALLPMLARRRDGALRAVRRYFSSASFVEIEAPILVRAASTETNIDPLTTTMRLKDDEAPQRRYLHTSPEMALKRVISAGVARVFSITKVFRDAERSTRHLPEFTLAEWYRAGGTLGELAEDVRHLLFAIASATKSDEDTLQCLLDPFPEFTVAKLFELHVNVDLDAVLDAQAAGDPHALVKQMIAAGHAVRPTASFEDAFFHAMVALIEPNIGNNRPVVVTRWPASQAVFARLFDDDPRYAQRAEIYWRGLELTNGFDEVTDPAEQRRRMEADNAARVALGKEPIPLDEVFLSSLKHMVPTAWIALGFDRALMALWREDEIDDVVVLGFR